MSEKNIIIHKAEVSTKVEKYSGIVSLILVQKKDGWTYEVEDMTHGNLPLTWRAKSPEKASSKLRDIYKDNVWDFKILE
ncbi:MAG: hypothetical protein JRE64_26665 [Deltaproteobacteria bacterium]|nr:hypothetical protein [Deltaproteobacteria bacterium]